MRQSVYHEHRFTYPQKGLCRPALCVLISLIFLTNFVVSSGAHLGPRLWGCQKVHILQHQWWWTKFTCGPTSWWWLWRWLSLRHVFFFVPSSNQSHFSCLLWPLRKWMYDNLCIIFKCQDWIVSLQMIKPKKFFDDDNIGNITQLWSFGWDLCYFGLYFFEHFVHLSFLFVLWSLLFLWSFLWFFLYGILYKFYFFHISVLLVFIFCSFGVGFSVFWSLSLLTFLYFWS